VSDLVPGVTVVIPTIPPREPQMVRALRSVQRAAKYWQDVAQLDDALPCPIRMDVATGRFIGEDFTLACEVVVDENHDGAAKTRHRGLERVGTEWTAFLDDDDEMHDQHLVALYRAAIEHNADFLWSRFRIQYPDGSMLAGPAFLGEKAFAQWNDDDPCQTTITTLVRTELALQAGGFAQFTETGAQLDGHRAGEDFEFAMRCRKAGAGMRHVPEVTWTWHHWGYGTPGQPGNTSGMPDRW
jgi:hypothetical protein